MAISTEAPSTSSLMFPMTRRTRQENNNKTKKSLNEDRKRNFEEEKKYIYIYINKEVTTSSRTGGFHDHLECFFFQVT